MKASAFSATARVLMALAAATFVVAAAIHFGVVIPVAGVKDRFLGAAVPEAVLAVVLAAGVVVATRWRDGVRAPALELGTTLFALAVTGYGLSVTATSARTGDIAYHVFVLTVLLLAGALLVVALVGRSRAMR